MFEDNHFGIPFRFCFPPYAIFPVVRRPTPSPDGLNQHAKEKWRELYLLTPAQAQKLSKNVVMDCRTFPIYRSNGATCGPNGGLLTPVG